MSSAHTLSLLGSPNHMWNVPGILSVAWHFVYRGTQGLCLNSEPGIPSLDFSEPRSCDDTIDTDYSKKNISANKSWICSTWWCRDQGTNLWHWVCFFKWVQYQVSVRLLRMACVHTVWVPLYYTSPHFPFCVQKFLGMFSCLLRDTQGILLSSA